MDLFIPLSGEAESLSRSFYSALRNAILAGNLPAGARLPSTRAMAEQHGVSRTTVLLAYEQLEAEGYITSRRGSGTYVNLALQQHHPARVHGSVPLPVTSFGARAATAAARVRTRQQPSLPYDFTYGSDVSNFPFALWNRTLLRCARRALVADLDYGDAAGHPQLRSEICGHLRRSRGVRCDPSRVIVVNGSQQALDLIARVLVQPGRRVAVEDPAYQGTIEILRVSGACLIPICVDHSGIDTRQLPAEACCVFVTPSHQFPTGATLPLERRLALLAWARDRNAIVIEDDYDGEFRYDGPPLESLQALDEDSRVIYIGTFSRTIFPSLRIGYLVVPTGLVSALTAAKWLCDRHTAQLEQRTLAEFIASGAYGRHLRRVRRRNAARRLALLEAIERHLRGRVDVTGDASGTHIVIWPKEPLNEPDVTFRLRERGVGLTGLASYYQGRAPRPGFILGYARLDETQIREGVRRIARIIRP